MSASGDSSMAAQQSAALITFEAEGRMAPALRAEPVASEPEVDTSDRDLLAALDSELGSRLGDASDSEYDRMGGRSWLDEDAEAEELLEEKSFDAEVVDELFAELGDS